ncbi:hypothetical protein [Clostridioides difficile]|uniref:hypothetical protein n=1 Tax=Clostridioides difficile TaxID=1496 RepID=UPI00129CF089|nr:hypothetical protein [Clostridioides difficile]
MQFSYELLTFHEAQTISYPSHYRKVYPLPLPIACSVLLSRGIVVEVSPIRSLPADCPF